jgi:hypothetical protein
VEADCVFAHIYFTDKGSFRDLGIFGVLYCNGMTFLRGIFVPDVPNSMLSQVEQALPEMITSYLESLGVKNVQRKPN